LAAQGGMCAACQGPMVIGGKDQSSVCADHDRSCCSGRRSCGRCVRGLIHRNCNLVIGYAKDDPGLLRNTIEYLERTRTAGPRIPATVLDAQPRLAPIDAVDFNSLGSSRAWQLRNPERCKAQAYWSKFRVDFEALWQTQNGNCACCGQAMVREGKDPTSVCVDHAQTCCPGKKSCGKCVRGLIHRNCNLVIGYARDDTEVLGSAAAYLERWQAQASAFCHQ
jgi:hypothetical protein